jgi:hypothetical protein
MCEKSKRMLQVPPVTPKRKFQVTAGGAGHKEHRQTKPTERPRGPFPVMTMSLSRTWMILWLVYAM